MCHVDYAYKVGMLRNYSFFDLHAVSRESW